MLILQSVARVAGKAFLKRILSEECIRSKVRDVGRMPSAKLPLQFLSMQKYVYSFQSAVGIFWIRPERDKSWGLYIGGEGILELLGYYGSAFAAADSVYTQSTGWDGWDQRKRIDAPETLLLWSRKLVK
jgi:hypothetical protein